jgi:hypothetical protein
VLVPQFQIRRDIWKNFRLFSSAGLHKTFRFSSAKRWFLPNSAQLDTLPHGYAGTDAPEAPAEMAEQRQEALGELIQVLNQVLAEDDYDDGAQ